MDVEFIGQLVDSMEEGVLGLEKAVKARDPVTANKMKIFIMDVQKKISEGLRS
ncbi:hypothetical protein HNV12_00715 [Methanococcoides sp. SA1]|nr:hypothetical protein [Methanococcoides sp. SA1]